MRRIPRWVWLAGLLVVILALILPLPVAERYTSPTQDGQFMTDPLLAYRFVVAAVLVSPSSELNTSGEALDHAKQVFSDAPVRPVKVELLFLPGGDPYTYTTTAGRTLEIEEADGFIWEVWGTAGASADGTAGETGGGSDVDVVALLDYGSGELLASVIEVRGSTDN
ncbi:MAG: hypothetical protein Kow00129_08690 [Thermoleophilia bacterium]